MAPAKKINLKDKVEDGEIDLSMLSLEDVPVREIASVKKVYSLDLSNNHLERLPNNFATLTNLTKIDLSKNNLKELPENFGNLEKLVHLDLYKNQLQHLPLSFHGLKNLKWLDLKDNPLVPAIAKIAGPCLDNKQCQLCAKSIIQFYSEMNEKVEQMKIDQKAQILKNLAYKAKQEKKKKDKKQRQKDKNDNLAKENIKKEEIETISEQIIEKEQETRLIVKQRSSSGSGVLRTIFLLIFFLSLGLFLLTAFKVKYLQSTEQHIVSMWMMLREYFPNYWENYVIIFEKKFVHCHLLIGNYLIRIYENLSNSPYMLLIQDYIFYTARSISKQLNEVFHNIL